MGFDPAPQKKGRKTPGMNTTQEATWLEIYGRVKSCAAARGRLPKTTDEGQDGKDALWLNTNRWRANNNKLEEWQVKLLLQLPGFNLKPKRGPKPKDS
jgi:hypothetical protein